LGQGQRQRAVNDRARQAEWLCQGQRFIKAKDKTEISAAAVNGSHVFWSNCTAKAIGRVNLDGTGVIQKYISVTGHPDGVAVNGSHVYWTNVSDTTIGRANLDGSPASVTQGFIA
jgi:hypothetical protein